jgi:hypothetical protein
MSLLVAGMATGFLVAPWKTKPVIADDDAKKITIRDGLSWRSRSSGIRRGGTIPLISRSRPVRT